MSLKKGYKSVPWLFGKEIEIPEKWEVKKCSKILELKHGYQFRDEDFIEGKKGIKIIKIGNLKQNGSIDSNTCDIISLDKKSDFLNIIINSGDVLMALTGATLGKTIMVPKINEILLQNYRVGNFYPRTNIDKKFLYYVLKNIFTQKQIWFLVNSNAQPNIGKEDFDKIKIICPTFSEQQKIATILSNVDNLIESTVQVITNSKKVKKGLMQKLLTRGIGHTKFKKVTMGLRYMLETYPEEWIISTLEENAELQRGKFGHRPRDDPEFYGGKYPFIQTGDVEKSNKYILTYSQTLNEKGLKVSKIFPKGIIVITIAANIGSTSITTFDTCFPDSLIGISTNDMNIEFLEYFMTTRKNYLNAVATTSAQKNINYETLNPLKIPVPPLPEQQKIASILSNIDSKIESQEKYKKKLERLKKSLMQKLLTGEVRVAI